MFSSQIKIITITHLLLQKYIVRKADNANAVTSKTLSNPVTTLQPTRIHDQWHSTKPHPTIECVFFLVCIFQRFKLGFTYICT